MTMAAAACVFSFAVGRDYQDQWEDFSLPLARSRCGRVVGLEKRASEEAAVSSGLEKRASEERATPSDDSVKGRRTTTSSGVRPSLDAGVGWMSDAAVTGVDDGMGAGMN